MALPAVVNREYLYVVSAASTGLLCSEDHMIFMVNHGRKGYARDRACPGSLSPSLRVSILSIHLSRASLTNGEREPGNEASGTLPLYNPGSATRV